jgi:hypothetical protein
MTQTTVAPPAWNPQPIPGDIDLTDPSVVATLVDIAHNFVALCCGVGYWSKLPRAQQVSNTASAIQDYVRARGFQEPLDVATALVDGGHMDPMPAPVVTPEPEQASTPSIIDPDRKLAEVIQLPGTVGAGVPDAATIDAAAAARDWGTYYVAAPSSILEAIAANTSGLGYRHVRLLAAITKRITNINDDWTGATGVTPGTQGGEVVVTVGDLAAESGWASASLRAALHPDSPFAPWAVQTGTRKERRIVITVAGVKKGEQWIKIPWWWGWDESGTSMSAQVGTKADGTPWPETTTDYALQYALTVQRVAPFTDSDPTTELGGFGDTGLCTLAGVSRTTLRRGKRHAEILGWVQSEALHGRGYTTRRVVTLHRP